MSGILDLPVELALEVFNAQSSIQDALHLSATCHASRQIFLSNLEHISSSIFRHNTTPSYDELTTVVDEMIKVGQVDNPVATTPPGFATLRVQTRLVRDGDLVINAYRRYFHDPELAPSWRCELGACYLHRPGFSPDVERARLFRAFLFVRLCMVSYGSPALASRRTQTLQNMPYLETWFINYICVGLFEDCVINESDAIALRILDPDIETDHKFDEDVSEWTEKISRQSLHALETMENATACEDQGPERKAEGNRVVGELHSSRVEGCGCDPVTFVFSDLAMATWLDHF